MLTQRIDDVPRRLLAGGCCRDYGGQLVQTRLDRAWTQPSPTSSKTTVYETANVAAHTITMERQRAVSRHEARFYQVYAGGRIHKPVLLLADGVDCVRLLPHDEARGALLLARPGRSLHELALRIGRRHEILCSTAGWV